MYDDDGHTALSLSLGKLTALTRLNVACLGVRGIRLLVPGIDNLRPLQHLDASTTFFARETATVLASFLAKLTSLETLQVGE